MAISPYGGPGRVRRPPWNASSLRSMAEDDEPGPGAGLGSGKAERREHARVEALAELTRLLAGALTPEAVGEVVADRVRAAVGGADALCLGVVSQDCRAAWKWITTVGYAEELCGCSSRTCRWTSPPPRPMPPGQAAPEVIIRGQPAEDMNSAIRARIPRRSSRTDRAGWHGRWAWAGHPLARSA